jgi:hypothetical protein
MNPTSLHALRLMFHSFSYKQGQLDGPYSFRCVLHGNDIAIEEEIRTQFLDFQHVQAMICKRLVVSPPMTLLVDGRVFDGEKYNVLEDGVLVTVRSDAAIPVKISMTDSTPSSSSILNGGTYNGGYDSSRYSRPKKPAGAVGLSNLGIQNFSLMLYRQYVLYEFKLAMSE